MSGLQTNSFEPVLVNSDFKWANIQRTMQILQTQALQMDQDYSINGFNTLT